MDSLYQGLPDTTTVHPNYKLCDNRDELVQLITEAVGKECNDRQDALIASMHLLEKGKR